MADPATGSVAAGTAITTTAGSMLALGSIMPAGASTNEFMWGIAFAIFGSFCFEFIKAQVIRQNAADSGIPISQRPQIDLALVGYAMCGAPLSAALLIFGIHQFHGATGFGDTTWLQSAAGFMVAGPVGPKIVIKSVAAFISLIGSRLGGAKP